MRIVRTAPKEHPLLIAVLFLLVGLIGARAHVVEAQTRDDRSNPNLSAELEPAGTGYLRSAAGERFRSDARYAGHGDLESPDELLRDYGSTARLNTVLANSDGSRDFTYMQPLPSDGRTVISSPALLTLDNGDILMAYRDWGIPHPDNGGEDVIEVSSVWLTRSADDGATWDSPQMIAEAISPALGWTTGYRLSLVATATGRIVLIRDDFFLDPDRQIPRARVHYSDDQGITWTEAPFPAFELPNGRPVRVYGPINGALWHVAESPFDPPGAPSNQILVRKSVDGLDWTADQLLWTDADPRSLSVDMVLGVAQMPSGDILAALANWIRWDGSASTPEALGRERTVSFIRSSDGGATWSVQQQIEQPDVVALSFSARATGGGMTLAPDSSLWLVLSMLNPQDLFPNNDIYYLRSTDEGVTWSEPAKFTEYRGSDILPAVAFTVDTALLAYDSRRSVVENPLPGWIPGGIQPDVSGVWYGIPGTTLDGGPAVPPALLFRGRSFGFDPVQFPADEITGVFYAADDETGVNSVTLNVAVDGVPMGSVPLLDDGAQVDGEAGDGVFGGRIGPFPIGSIAEFHAVVDDVDGNSAESVPETIHALPVHDVGNIAMNIGYGSLGPSLGTGFAPPFYRVFSGDPPGLLWPASEAPVSEFVVDPLLDAGIYNYLYAGGFVVGVDSIPGQPGPFVTGQAGYNQTDWALQPPVVLGNDESYQSVVAVLHDTDARPPFADNLGTIPLGLEIKQTSYTWAEPERDDFIIVEYDITNRGTVGDIEGMRAALWLDPDIPLDPFGGNDDQLAYEPGSRVLYQFDSGTDCNSPPPPLPGTRPWPEPGTIPCPEGYVGLAWLTDGDDQEPSAWELSGELDLLNLWEPMTGGVNPALSSGVPLEPADYKFIVATQPFNLPSGETHKEAFGIVMGAGLAELIVNTQRMREACELNLNEVCKTTGNEPPDGSIPSAFALHQNYPNPFNPSTVITFDLPIPAHVSLRIFDVLGREVANLASERRTPGRHQLTWDASGVASGVYFYRFETGDFSRTRTLTVIK
jgi:hypothetical protein